MGRRGPPRKPTALLEASGATKLNPGRYADRALEPQPDAMPESNDREPPVILTEQAKKHWPVLSKMLRDSRVLSVNDNIALAQLCEAFATWVKLKDQVLETRLPAVHRQYDQAWNRLLKIQQEFGMTPASRSRVQALPKPPDKNPYGRMAGERGRREEDEQDGD